MFKICSKLTINTPERYHWRNSYVLIVNFEKISHIVSTVDLEQVNGGW